MKTGRHCGECTLCCRLLSVVELGKGAGQTCEHQCSKGCRIYRKHNMPEACRMWSCRWLVDPAARGLRRPDRIGYVVDILPDIIRATSGSTTHEIVALQVWCDPRRPDAWRDPALLAYAAERSGGVMLVRYDSRRGFVVQIDEAGVAHQHETSVGAASKTGSLWLDKMTAGAGD